MRGGELTHLPVKKMAKVRFSVFAGEESDDVWRGDELQMASILRISSVEHYLLRTTSNVCLICLFVLPSALLLGMAHLLPGKSWSRWWWIVLVSKENYTRQVTLNSSFSHYFITPRYQPDSVTYRLIIRSLVHRSGTSLFIIFLHRFRKSIPGIRDHEAT